jgi:hypothetical protein
MTVVMSALKIMIRILNSGLHVEMLKEQDDIQ